ncbi:hypothetical protein [Okeania sp.]|uniref:hypothetical protein n=1 Tax=Okeania sp. TaxID=3100323 RepID=UPI002B4AE1B4|nr:hypothetical protein [Okeania sp.]MEB3342027.1 hypothetical protein [Okeania sp.]
MKNIEIHEFSTGIIPEILPDGKWISKGFKIGEYMNLTLPQVPHSIARAIANKSFEVGKNRDSQEPTLVGRVVLSMSSEEPDYSVVAVVTSGQDEYGRSTSFYRYFFCVGKDNIWQILDWMNSQKQYRTNLIFNPSETKEIGKPNQHKITRKPGRSLPKDLQDWLKNQNLPAIIPPELSDLQIINKMAETKANEKPTSWIYHAETVEQPEQFIIIHPANAEVAASLTEIQTKIIENSPKNISKNIDEAAIETAIKGLIGGSKIKQEWIENLVLKLQTGEITSEDLNKLFDNLGASNAIKQGNTNSQMIRLLTLRAILIPETLAEYLDWLNITRNEKKENEKQKISLTLQSQLRNNQKLLEPLILRGVNDAFYQILGKKISIPACCWLFNNKDNLWSKYSSQIIQQVREDLESFGNSLSNKTLGKETDKNAIWKNLISWLKSPQENCNYYQPLADLFSQLPDYELAAYFHQISNGKVPRIIFSRAFPKSKSKVSYETTIFGLTVQKELVFSEKMTILIMKYGRPVVIIFLVMISHGLFFGLGHQVSKFNTKDIFPKKISEVLPSKEEKSTYLETTNLNEISTVKMEKALEKFPTTSRIIQKVVRELEEEILDQNSTIVIREQARLEIVKAIHKILKNDVKFQYVERDEKEFTGEADEYLAGKKEWIAGIYFYQKNFFNDGFGYIEPNKTTADKLKCDIADLLEINLQKRPRRCGKKS